MGRAIVREADAFLFDEPLSNLDAQLRGQMRTEISRLQQRLGVTTVYVTHDQVEAMTLGDRVAVLRRGELQQVDTPRALYLSPVNLFVAGFIGSPSMNLLPAKTFPAVPLDLPDDRELVIGVRPEHLADEARVDPAVRARGVAFDVEVEAIEWLGAEQLLYVPWEAPAELVEPLNRLAAELDREVTRPQLVARIDPESEIRAGEKVRLWFDPSHLHVFDARTGERIAASRL
jgi:multiple sugar transport system ATP-binding protein